MHFRLALVSSEFALPAGETTYLFQPFASSGRAKVLGPASFTQHQGAVGAALLPTVEGLPGGIAGNAGPCGNVIKSFSDPGWRNRARSAWGRTLNGVRLERVGKKGESVELIMAVGCCLHGNLLRRALLHWVDHLGTFKVGRLNLLVPLRICLETIMPLMVGLLDQSRVGRRAVLIVFVMRILGILVMSKVLNRACNVAVNTSAEMCVNADQVVSSTNRESPMPVVAAATQD